MLLFGIFSLEGSQPFTLFCKSMSSDKNQSFLPEHIELFHKYKDNCLLRVAEKLYSVYHFHRASHLRNSENDIQLLNSDDILPAFEVGHFKLDSKEPFNFEMQIVWLTINEIAFSFVLDKKENLSQGEMILRLVVQQLHDLCRVAFQVSEIVAKPEKIHYVLNKFVSGGKLVFMNHRTIRQMDRETESALKVMSS